MNKSFAPDPEDTADALDSLLRGEISAAETYGQAISKVEGRPEADTLRSIRDDHVAAANALRRHVVARGEEASTSSGAWGAFAKAVEGTAKLFGNASAFKALREGEEHGMKEYERALARRDLDAGARTLIETRLMAQQRAHLPVIDRLAKLS